jgi:uncharacterized protein YifN (PemK superfamily)
VHKTFFAPKPVPPQLVVAHVVAVTRKRRNPQLAVALVVQVTKRRNLQLAAVLVAQVISNLIIL